MNLESVIAERPIACAVALAILLAFLSGCQSTPGPGPVAFSAGSDAALPVMERVALKARECWFRSGDPQFRGYRMAPELDSYSGRPRILLEPAHELGGRPKLVVQAEGNPAKVEAYGPMMNMPIGTRVSNDVRRWAAGGSSC